jgi:prefoldin subunit 5
MPGKLDEISRAIGSLETSVRELQRRTDENRETQTRRHADNAAALRELAAKLDQHAESVEMIRPTVAALELSRSKLATWASLGFAVAVLAGWVVEAAFKWAVDRVLSHFQG